MSSEEQEKQIETFKVWLKSCWEWTPHEITERHRLMAQLLHVPYTQFIDALADVPLSDGDEYNLFIYHLCIFLKSLELHQKEAE